MVRRTFCKVLLAVVVAVFGILALSGVLFAQGRSAEAFERVKEVQERNTDRLMEMDDVEGTAIGLDQSGQLAVKVFTARPGVAGIAKELDGVPVQVVVTGKIYALAKGGKGGKSGKPPKPNTVPPPEKPLLWCERPVPIGVSTGHPDITAGTIACRVTDGINVYALSNNHVYANENRASIGDNVLQPGTYDGGEDPDDAIGTLAAFEPIVFSRKARNEIDAAIAFSSTANLGTATPAGGYGTPNSTDVGAFLGQQVQKFGRTTELTQGVITYVNATVNVGYSRGTARFVKQIIVESGTQFIGGGDSGSLLVTDNPDDPDLNLNPVGLLFAGTGDGLLAVANRIDLVLDRFNVTVDDSAEGPVDDPPTVTITSPADGATVSETVSISADAIDDIGVVKVDFYVGETLIGVDGTYPYSVSWDSTTVADGTYIIKATATDTASQTASDSISVTVDNINDPPVADAGPDQTATVGQTVNFDGSGSSDPDGTIVSYDWDFGDDSTGTGKTIAHEYSIAGTYTVTLIVTDNGGETVQDTATVTVTEEPAEIEVFSDSFESSTDWTANWSQDSQNDWSRRTSRKKEGNYAAEVDGRATDAQLISIPIDLQGKKNATITFWWFIESGLDKGEYLAFDVSTDGGVNWTEMASLEGNVDPENTWHNVSIDVDVTAINNLRIRFRGTMSSSIEDAYVDVVKVVAW